MSKTYKCRKGQIVQVVANAPVAGQDDISDLLGQKYEVKTADRETGVVQVHADEFAGLITLNVGEYKIVEF